MSRIGKLPVAIPEGVKAEIEGATVRVEGPKGKLEKTFDSAVTLAWEDDQIVVRRNGTNRHADAMYGTARSVIQNMVAGVKDGFRKRLLIEGVGFRAALQGDTLDLSLGYSHRIHFPVPEGVTIQVEDNTKITVSGADKQAVGAAAARIRGYYPAEPYKGKGVRIEGEYVRRKEGKKSA